MIHAQDCHSLFKNFRSHPCLFIVPIVEPTLFWTFLFKAVWLFGLSNVNWWKVFTTICITCKANRDPEFGPLLATHLLRC